MQMMPRVLCVFVLLLLTYTTAIVTTHDLKIDRNEFVQRQDMFGQSIAISDLSNLLLIGSRNSTTGAGAVFLYEESVYNARDWGSNAAPDVIEIVPSDVVSTFYGTAVAWSDEISTLFCVGSYGDESYQGAVYCYDELTVGGKDWQLNFVKITATDGVTFDLFGFSLALSGRLLLVGAYGDDSDTSTEAGAAYIYHESAAFAMDWGPDNEVKLLPATEFLASGNNHFGSHVTLSSSSRVLAIGAVLEADYTGALYIFSEDIQGNENWVNVAKLIPSDQTPTQWFTCDLDMTDNVVVVGAWGDQEFVFRGGAIYVYVLPDGDAGSYSEVLGENLFKLVGSDVEFEDRTGMSVALSGRTIASGSPNCDQVDCFHATGYGKVYVFIESALGMHDWQDNEIIIEPSDPQLHSLFGWSVDISGITVAVGAMHSNTNGKYQSGASYFYFLEDACVASNCQNGGICVEQDTSFICECADGFTGVSCDTTVDDDQLNPCLSSPCWNGGLCSLEQENTFICECADGFFGISCDAAVDDDQLNPCLSSPCWNGGLCWLADMRNDSFICDCVDGYEGSVCSMESTPQSEAIEVVIEFTAFVTTNSENVTLTDVITRIPSAITSSQDDAVNDEVSVTLLRVPVDYPIEDFVETMDEYPQPIPIEEGDGEEFTVTIVYANSEQVGLEEVERRLYDSELSEIIVDFEVADVKVKQEIEYDEENEAGNSMTINLARNVLALFIVVVLLM